MRTRRNIVMPPAFSGRMEETKMGILRRKWRRKYYIFWVIARYLYYRKQLKIAKRRAKLILERIKEFDVERLCKEGGGDERMG